MSEMQDHVAQTLGEFVTANAQQDKGGDWQLENDRLLEIHLSDGLVYTKTGAMIAYYGDLKFERAGIKDQGGLGKFVKAKMTGESASTMKVQGTGVLYCADMGKTVRILRLQGETVFVNGANCLAYSHSLDWDIVRTKGGTMLAGGLFSLQLSGQGYCAITTMGQPVVLGVDQAHPLCSDPNATVAWSSDLQVGVKTDVSLKTFTGRSSGESYQLCFNGQGFVVLQPFEEGGSSPGGGSSGSSGVGIG
jgi:uncharacterized protein (AIM24 family)